MKVKLSAIIAIFFMLIADYFATNKDFTNALLAAIISTLWVIILKWNRAEQINEIKEGKI